MWEAGLIDQPVRSLDRESPPGLICSEMQGMAGGRKVGSLGPRRQPSSPNPSVLSLQLSSRGLSELDDHGGSVYPQNLDASTVKFRPLWESQTNLFKREICIMSLAVKNKCSRSQAVLRHSFQKLLPFCVSELTPAQVNSWRRKWEPTPVFLPGESQGQRSLVGCRLWGCIESDTTEAT